MQIATSGDGEGPCDRQPHWYLAKTVPTGWDDVSGRAETQLDRGLASWAVAQVTPCWACGFLFNALYTGHQLKSYFPVEVRVKTKLGGSVVDPPGLFRALLLRWTDGWAGPGNRLCHTRGLESPCARVNCLTSLAVQCLRVYLTTELPSPV